jgi:hypothetical protein
VHLGFLVRSRILLFGKGDREALGEKIPSNRGDLQRYDVGGDTQKHRVLLDAVGKCRLRIIKMAQK